jgi:acetyl/propionyl-CoA carboxylase alpha subunit
VKKLQFQSNTSPDPLEIQLESHGPSHPDKHIIRFRNAAHELEIVHRHNTAWLRIHGRIIPIHIARSPQGLEVWLAGRKHILKPVERTARRATGTAAHDLHEEIKAPMPGTILKINFAAGDIFEAHAPLVVMESMKMEMSLSAPHAGRVDEILCQIGQLVPMDHVLVRLSSENADASGQS